MSTDAHLLDDYQLHNVIAMGSQSQIWEASLQGSSERVAIKLLLSEPFKDAEQLNAFKAEAKLLGSLNHPNIVKFIKYAKTKTHAYIVMELFRSPNLRTYLSNDIVSLQARFKRVVELSCLAIGYLHEKGLVHKDIKPENILLSKGGELKLVDFALCTKYATGVAKMFSGKPKVIQGTRSYLAPETIKKEAPAPQTDIYSLGIVLYEILVGKTPFQGTSPTELLRKHISESPIPPSDFNKNVTKEADRFILKMLAKKMGDRQKSMQEVFSEVRNIKIFKEDVEELQARTKTTDTDELFSGLQRKLDSRADAKRMEQIKSNPELAKQFTQSSVGKLKTARTNFKDEEPVEPQKPPEPAPAPATPAANAYPPGYPQQQMPGGYPYPMYPPGVNPAAMPYPPGQYYYPPQGMPPQGMPPQGIPPGYPYPNMPYPGQAYPQMPYPPGAMPPGIPPGVAPGFPPPGAPQQTPATPPTDAGTKNPNEAKSPAASQPQSSQPATPPPTQKKSVAGHVRIDSTTDEDLDNIPVMDELPDFD